MSEEPMLIKNLQEGKTELFISYYKQCFPDDKLFNYILNTPYLKSNRILRLTSISFVDSFPDSRSGEYWPYGNKINILKGLDLDSSLLLHEFGHALLEFNLNLKKTSYNMFLDATNKIASEKLKTWYGFTNYQEFFCELISNHSFYAFVASFYIIEEDNPYWEPYAHLFPKWFTPNDLFYKLDRHLK